MYLGTWQIAVLDAQQGERGGGVGWVQSMLINTASKIPVPIPMGCADKKRIWIPNQNEPEPGWVRQVSPENVLAKNQTESQEQPTPWLTWSKKWLGRETVWAQGKEHGGWLRLSLRQSTGAPGGGQVWIKGGGGLYLFHWPPVGAGRRGTSTLHNTLCLWKACCPCLRDKIVWHWKKKS